MARYLAIDWDQQQLCVVEGTADRGTVNVRQARVWPEPMALSPATAEEAGKRLKARLREAGMSAAPVLFSVARDKVIFRDIRYPDVPANEVSAIVRFQAMKEIQMPADEVVIDYATSGASWPTGEKRALAAAIRGEHVAAIQKMCQSAGLKLESVSPRAFGISAEFERTASGNAVIAVLIATIGGGELCICRGHELLFSRALSAVEGASGPMTALLPDLRRTLAAYESQFAEHPVTALHVAADGEDFFPAELEATLRIPARQFRLLDGKAVRNLPESGQAALAGPLGLLHMKSSKAGVAINFLAPKQPPPPDTRKRRYAGWAAAAAILLALTGGGMYTMASMAKDEELRELQERSASLKKQIDAFGDLEKRVEAVQQWDSSDIVVLDELYDLIAKFPDLPGIQISEVRWEPVATEIRAGPVRPAAVNGKPAGKTPIKHVSKLTIIASSESPAALEALRKALDGDRHWKLEQWLLDQPARQQITATFKVFSQEAHEYQAVLGPAKHVTASSGGERRQPTRDRRFQRGGRQ